MENLNLLPPELAPKSKNIRIASVSRKIATLGFCLYIVYVLVIGGVIYISTNKQKKAMDKLNQLETSVTALMETEQRLIIIQNRLAMYNAIDAIPSANKSISEFEKLSNSLPEGSSVLGYKITDKESNFSTAFQSSDDLEDLISYLKNYPQLMSLVMNSINHSQLISKADFIVSFK